MNRIRRGWDLTKKSWALLRGHPALLRFPLYGFFAMLVPVAMAVAGIFLVDAKEYAPGVALAAVGIYLISFVAIYFGVGLAAAADEIFHGREASVGEGLRAASGQAGKIAGWALVSAVVGTALSALEYSGKWAEVLVGSLLSAAWGLITFMAPPVIAIEGTGPIETLKRSASLFRERWAGQVTGNVAIGGLVMVLGILPAVALVVVGIVIWIGDGGGEDIAMGGVLVALGTVLFSLSTLVLRALRGVFGVALYRFAADGEVTGGFTSAELESAVRTRN